MAKLRMQINIEKKKAGGDTVITLCKLSPYARVNPEVWAVPGNDGKLEMEPIQITLKQPGQEVSKKLYPILKEGRNRLQLIESLLVRAC